MITFKLTPFSRKEYALTNLLCQARRRSFFLSPTCMEIIKVVLLPSFLRVWEFMFHLNEHCLPRKQCWPSRLVWYLELSHHPQETGGLVPLELASMHPALPPEGDSELLHPLPWSLLLFFMSMLTKLCCTESKNGVTTSLWLVTTDGYVSHPPITATHTTTRILRENLMTLRISLGWSPQAWWWIFKRD